VNLRLLRTRREQASVVRDEPCVTVMARPEDAFYFWQ